MLIKILHELALNKENINIDHNLYWNQMTDVRIGSESLQYIKKV